MIEPTGDVNECNSLAIRLSSGIDSGREVPIPENDPLAELYESGGDPEIFQTEQTKYDWHTTKGIEPIACDKLQELVSIWPSQSEAPAHRRKAQPSQQWDKTVQNPSSGPVGLAGDTGYEQQHPESKIE